MSIEDDDLARRLRRIHAAVGSTLEHDLTKFRAKVTPNVMHLNFRGGLSQEEIENFAWSAIHNVSTFYSHLMVWAGSNDPLKARIKEVNEASKALTILRALDNKDKHPKAKDVRAGQELDLIEVTRAAQLSAPAGGRAGFMIGPDGSIVRGENMKVAITGTVINKATGERLGTLSEYIEEAVKVWEEFMRELGLL